MAYQIRYSRDLAHHGILGQKWGIRRYQYEDGTLTPLGRERYGTVERLNQSIARKKMVRNVAIGIGIGVAGAVGAKLVSDFIKSKYADMTAQQLISTLSTRPAPMPKSRPIRSDMIIGDRELLNSIRRQR